MKGLDDEPNCGKSVDNKVTNGVSASLRSPLHILRDLQLCQEAWAPGSPWDHHGAHAALWGRPAGSFLVVSDSSSQNQLLCVSVDGPDKPILDVPILLTGPAYTYCLSLSLSHAHSYSLSLSLLCLFFLFLSLSLTPVLTLSGSLSLFLILSLTALRLTASQLAFSNLLQLVTFYTLSRDVLPLCLLVPSWVHSLTKQPSHLLSQLGPKTWLCPSADLQPVAMTPGTTDSQDIVMCSIQLTTSSGALCIINPLYLHEHGDDWLTQTSQPISPQPISQPGNLKRDRQMSTARRWVGTAVKKRDISSDEASNSSNQSAGSAVQSPDSPVTTEGVVLRRSSCSNPDSVKRVSVESLGSPVPMSPHRVSWVEEKFWLNPPPHSSLLHPPCLELDSLSVSSIEEEPEAESTISPSQSQHFPRLPLADKVKNRLSAVGQALGSLMSPQRRLSKRVQEMSERRGGTFAEAVRAFVEHTLKVSAAPGGISADVLQEVRASLTALRETLYDYIEIQSITDTLTDVPDADLDAMLEMSLHKVALKPVSSQLCKGIREARQGEGSLHRLGSNCRTLASYSLEELEGTVGAGVPDAATIEKIQQYWSTMHQAYSPNKKADTLLKVCKNVYHSMQVNAKPGVVFGADDFLPCLTWVVLRSDVATLQIDTDYMMELLDPSQLQGESGYYLTSLYAALFYISSFRPRLAARTLSAEAHKSLSQWHRRRTLHCNQSRRSKNRRTIRRHGRGEGVKEDNTGAAESLSNQRGESAGQRVTDMPPPGDVTKTEMRLEVLTLVGEEEEEKEERQTMEDQKNID